MPPKWLSFQNEDGSQRCRLVDVPPNWQSLTDERLDLLRRLATPATLAAHRNSPPGGVAPFTDDTRGPSPTDERD